MASASDTSDGRINVVAAAPRTQRSPAITINRDPSNQPAPNENNGLLGLQYKTPQQAYMDALDFATARISKSTDTVNSTNPGIKINNMLRTLNDSKFVYPGVAIVMMSIIAIIMIFQKNMSLSLKIVIILLLLAFIVYTVLQFRH